MAAPTRGISGWLAALFSFAIAITLTKFGNPIIFRALESPPANLWEVLLTTWPATWSYGVAALLCGVALLTHWKRVKTLPIGVVVPLLAWLFWTGLSMKNSVDPALSRLTVLHFASTTAVFFLATAFIPTLRHAQTFFRVMIFALTFALWLGWDQHYGGLEATRRALYESGAIDRISPEFKVKIASNRIFGPFVYPNAFAGAILIWAPVLTLALWEWTSKLPSIAQKVLVGLFIYANLACFFWTGSKAGWLIAIAAFVVGLLHLKNLKRGLKVAIIASVIVCGLIGFAIKNRAYFQKGATSASARLIYWQAALQVANTHPIVGAGPGTFAKTFAPIKPPEAEMARLVHNDYLEQACDSGWPAFTFFAAFVAAAVFFSHKAVAKSPYHLAAWLGLIGWSLQSFVEFGLYIPAISWSAFVLFGWLLASRFDIDTPKPAP
jgi:O-antigen ligase